MGSERYASTSEQYEQFTQELQNLPPRMAYVRLHDQPPVRVRTLTIRQPELPEGALRAVIDRYRQLYQCRRSDIGPQVFQSPVSGASVAEPAAGARDGEGDPPPGMGRPRRGLPVKTTGAARPQAGPVDYAELFGEEVADDDE